MIFHEPANSVGNYNYKTAVFTAGGYAPHFHKNAEVLLVLRGAVDVTVSGMVVRPTVGQAVLVLPNQIHTFNADADSCVWLAVFSEDFVPKFVNDAKGRQGSTPLFTPPAAVWQVVLTEMVERDCERTMKIACLYALCAAYEREVTWKSRADKSDVLVGGLLDWLSRHYADDATLKGAAQYFGYEYHYFSHLLSQQYNINFRRLLNQYRVEAAVHLLENTSLPITDIALKSGFQTVRSFNHVFRECTGRSPREYR